jgi:phage regulator Rha-like protein
MSKASILLDEAIINKIYQLRGQKVMLDRDLAELYDIKPIRLREQVKRNQARFPENFMFQLTEEESESMVSQNAIPSKQHLGGYRPYAFTEHGVLMLANVLRSGRAIQMSIRIIEVFVKMREMLLAHKDILLKLEQLEHKINEHDGEIQHIFDYLKKMLIAPQKRNPIGFKQNE